MLFCAKFTPTKLSKDDDHDRKNLEITTLEREIAHRLAQTPYILLLSCPGINVVSAADFAGEMGPIENYANCRSITGRAGLFPAIGQPVADNGKRLKGAEKGVARKRALSARALARLDHWLRLPECRLAAE